MWETLEDRLEQLRKLDNLHPHIHFLQKRSYLLPNKVRILGTTLWSHVPPETALNIEWRLNDYRYIWTVVENKVEDAGKRTQRRITVDDTNRWHAEEHAWLLQEIEKARENGEKVVVITHHAPSRRDTCSEEDEQSGLMDAFVNDHDADCKDPVRLWFYGHTHRSTDLTINSTRVISNQLGYTHEKCGFRPNMKISLCDDGTIIVTDSIS